MWSYSATRILTAVAAIISFAANGSAAVLSTGTSRSCSNLPKPNVPGAQVLSVTGAEVINGTFPPLPPYFFDTVTGLSVCNVTVILTHPGLGDRVVVEIFLPISGWNGRFQALGGGGLATSFVEYFISREAIQGYAAARTDGGHLDDFFHATSWALLPDGSVNMGLLENWASRSYHDMAVVGKAITESYYGKKPSYSYFQGCSTGGRSGLAEAQIYPGDFDGIIAAAPFVNTPSAFVADQWPQVVMNVEGYHPTACEFQAFLVASIVKCDALDGVNDGIVSNLDACQFDPYSLVGTNITCDGTSVTITRKTADIVRKIREGPKTAGGKQLWYGLNAVTDFQGTAATQIINGSNVGYPFTVSDDWISLFLEQDYNFNTSTITYAKFRQLFAKSNSKYNNILAINNPNLSAFQKAGGKLITWQGLADDLVSPEGTLNYYQSVQKKMGTDNTLDFYRLFMVPGGGHCYGVEGPIPNNFGLNQLVAWVENGTAPEVLPAGPFVSPFTGATLTRNLCRYPLVSKWDGKNDPNLATSYGCATTFT